MKKTVDVDIELTSQDIAAWLSEASEFDLFYVFREAAVLLGPRAVRYLRDNAPGASLNLLAKTWLLAAEAVAKAIEAESDDKEQPEST